VLVESGLNATRVGKLLMSACFVTDMGTAIALSAIFIKPNAWFPVFLVVSVALIVALPKISPWFFRRYGDRVIEPEIKLVFACLFLLMVIADQAKGHAGAASDGLFHTLGVVAVGYGIGIGVAAVFIAFGGNPLRRP
jgi:Kef-type K+ transport system membrane component KefB